MPKKWINWAGSVVHDSLTNIYTPSTKDELKGCIRDAAARGLKIRAVGSGHSWSQLGLDTDNSAIITTDRLNRILEIDRAAQTVRVEGGIKLYDLNKKLFENGLALPNLGDTDRQSIAGVVSTDTHGSGAKLGSFSELVEAVTLITSEGREYEVPQEELPAARISLGLLGVVYALKVQVVPSFYLRHVSEVVVLRAERDKLPELLENNRNIEYWYYPYTGKAERVTRNQVPPVKHRSYALRHAMLAAGALWADLNGRIYPKRLPKLFTRAMKFRSLKADVREGPSHQILPSVAQSTVDILKTLTMEYQFDSEKLWECVDELDESIEVARRKGVYIGMPIHIRFTKINPRALLSHCLYDITASFSINFSKNYRGAHIWLPELEKRLIQKGAKTHWGKIFYTEPKIPESFLEVRNRLDPIGIFANKQKVYVPD